MRRGSVRNSIVIDGTTPAQAITNLAAVVSDPDVTFTYDVPTRKGGHSVAFSGVAVIARACESEATPTQAYTTATVDGTFATTGWSNGNWDACITVSLTGVLGNSAHSNIVQFSIGVAPTVPRNLAVTNGGSVVHLSWTASSGTITGYKLYGRAHGSGDPFELFTTVGQVTTLDDDSHDYTTVNYDLKLVSYNGNGESASSNTVTTNWAE